MASHKSRESKVKYYHSKYITYSRAIAVMWGVLVISFLIITLVCFIQPVWVGSKMDESDKGHFGLWNYYVKGNIRNGNIDQETYVMQGEFLEFSSIPSDSFRAATVFVGLTVLLMIICVLCFFLFCCLSTKVVFMICGVLLSICVVLMFLACVIYPGGFDAEAVREVCNSSSYNKGDCVIQWAYILAIIAIFDGIVLTILAFCLAFKQVKLLPSQEKKAQKIYMVDNGPSDYNGATLRSNGAPQSVRPVVIVDSRESVHSQPIGTLRSHRPQSKHNFQL